MKQSDQISQYLKTVCEQIRWKKAHDVISEEIENHIIDQINAFMANGLDEEIATDKAIKEMGDPIMIGSELDRAHRPKIEWSIIALTASILLIGFAIRTFMTYDTGMAPMLTNGIISTILGIGCMSITYFLDFTVIGKYSKIIYFGLVIILIGTMIISPMINGRYFYSQFMLLFFPTAFAGIIYNMRSKGYLGIFICGLFFMVTEFIGLNISGSSSVFLYSLACLILLTFAIAKGWFYVRRLSAMLLIYIPTFITSIIIIIAKLVSVPGFFLRIQTSINPSLDPVSGYIGLKIRDIITNAKFLDQGEFGIRPDGSLPGINTDFILTYLIHRFGWISFLALMMIVLAFIIRSFLLCSKQKSVLGRLVSTAILITFTIEVILYVIFNLGFTLFAPLTLPLISYGGRATIINMILIGLLLSVLKSNDLVRDNLRTSTYKKRKIFELVDGKIIVDLNTKRY